MVFAVVVPSASFTYGRGGLALSGTVAARGGPIAMSGTAVARGGVVRACKAAVRGGALALSGASAARGVGAVMVCKAAARIDDFETEENDLHESVKSAAQQTVDMMKSDEMKSVGMNPYVLLLLQMGCEELLEAIEKGLIDQVAARELMQFHARARRFLRLHAGGLDDDVLKPEEGTRASLLSLFNNFMKEAIDNPKVTLLQIVKFLTQNILYVVTSIGKKPFPVWELEVGCEELLQAIEKGFVVSDQMAAKELMRLHARALIIILPMHGCDLDDNVLKLEESTGASLLRSVSETKECIRNLANDH